MMTVLAERDGRVYVAVEIDHPGAFASPFPRTTYACLLWDHGCGFTDKERLDLAKSLLDCGCRYVVCGGEHCEAWHDAVDSEFVNQHVDVPEEALATALVLTTWHEGESPAEVAFFFVSNTNFGCHTFDRYLVLHLGAGPATEQLDAAVRDHALAGEV